MVSQAAAPKGERERSFHPAASPSSTALGGERSQTPTLDTMDDATRAMAQRGGLGVGVAKV